MREPGQIAISHKKTFLPNGFRVSVVELPIDVAEGRFHNVVYDRSPRAPEGPVAPIHHTRHHTLLEALAFHPHVVDDYRDHPRVVTGPARKGKK